MNIKTRPLMIGAGVGAVLLVLFSLVAQGTTYFVVSDDPSVLTAGSGILTALGCLGWVCPVVVVIAAGYIYGHLANQEEPMETQDAAIGGAATGAVAGIIFGVVGGILNIVVTQVLLPDIYAGIAGDLGGDAGAALGGIMAGAGIVGALVSACCWLIGGAVLGAVGGIIANAVAGRGKA